MVLFSGLTLFCLLFQGLVFVKAEIIISIHELQFHSMHRTRGKTRLRFDSTDRPISLTPGLSFGFSCDAADHTATPWYANSTSVPLRDPDSVGESLVYYYDKGTERILTFQYYNSTMNGNYSCTTASSQRTLIISEGAITVLLEYQTYNKDTVVGNSLTVTLQVFYAGIPTPSADNLTWYFNGDLITDQLRSDLSITPFTSTLFVIQGFSLIQDGVYLLNVTTSAGTAAASFFFDIKSRPAACFITSGSCLKQWERTMSLNSSFVLNCTDDSGDPLSTFQWFKDDINITASTNPQLSITQYTDRISYLTVTNVSPELAGSYKCATNNGIGKSQAVADILVEFTPNVSRITPLNSSVPVGQSIQLLVHFIGGYPLPTVTWYRLLGITNSNRVPITDPRASASGQYSLNLTITNSSLSDDGLYLLMINNTIGAIEIEFNVTILVPPVLTNLSSLVLFHRSSDCAQFLVSISSAKPPVTSSLIQWSGLYQSERSTALLMNGVSNMTLCGLVTDDTGPVTMTITHPGAPNISITFHLTVWGPPLPPSNLRISRVSSCIILLDWSNVSIATPTPTAAPINNVILITSYCDSSSMLCTQEKEELFSLSVNNTRLHLLPYKEYTFSLLSVNNLIGRGISRNNGSYSTLSDGAGFSPVVVSSNITANSSYLSISWFPPTQSSTCYNISHYSLDCYRGQVSGGRGVAPVYSTNVTADVRRDAIHVHVPVMAQDTRYYCLINVIVSDVSGGVYSLTTPTNMSVNTLPVVPPPPATPTFSGPTETDKPYTVTINLSGFKPSLHNVGIIRIGVLRLGSSPTLPSGSPDSLYASDQFFTSYEAAHRPQGGGPNSKPYFAVELTIDSIGDSFVVGSESNDTRNNNKRREAAAVFTNGPLDDESYYTFFIRAYSHSRYGPQYKIYSSTSFTSPVKPVSGSSPTTDRPTSGRREGGGSVGIAVGVVFFVLLLIAVAVTVLVVLILFWRKSKRKASTTLSSVEHDGSASPPRSNQYTSHEEIKARTSSLSSKDSPVRSPVTNGPPVTSGPPVVIGSVPAATNPCYTQEEEEEEVKRPPSVDGEPFLDDALSLSEFNPPPLTPSSLTSAGHVTMDTIDTCISMDTSVISNGAAANGSYSPSDFKPGEHVGRDEFQEHVEKLDKNKQEIFNEIFEFINSTSPDYACIASLAAHEYDQTKNRYRDVGAFDHTRVTLQEIPGVPHSHYINANFIKGYHDDKLYIATQGPKEETTDDFWRMVWEQRTVTIVMLTNLMESYKSKCHQYWPSSGQCCYGDIAVRVDRNIELPHYTIRGFKVFNERDTTEKERTVLQFHYTAWPDRNVPAQASHVLDFLRAINSANDKEEYGPIVVHCSAGVGRTGTIIALDIALEQLKLENKVDIKGIVTFLRKQRKQMVQALCQYIFIHNAILEDIVYGDTAVTIDEFKDRCMKLQEPTLINEEFNKIGSVKPPAQACPGPSIVPFETDKDSKFTSYYLDGYWTPNLFIKSPSPTKETEELFWRLIVQNECTHIINLSPADITTYSYIPPDVGDRQLKFGPLTVSVGRKQFNTGFSTRDISIFNEEDSSTLKLKYIQYQEMLLKQCFPRADKFIKFIQGCLVEAESCHRGNHPILIHDDGSNGPVGIFATLAYCLQRAKKERIIDLLQSANHHYLQCPGLIVNLQFYAYCYDCLLEYSDKLLKEESLPPIYENIASIRGKLVPSPEPLDEKHKEVMELGYDIL
ncbi:PREDICTED: receptor-type tyrosine-protein phosphatase kappa-like [Amphimedon queenslandica]|uniref:protein-tyrosine-phosphatase n=1 Tax=Amphimedon queenslandica TaxID=400682 RepID=A0A1X7U5Q5_AMPQE|nr:PREDICTED: receptor-type tyrosine-protein phosphatase kappa-like [Amphimedon queenslandica]|eukprot:XP_019856082.1 PREDICTED: receptor-type tyrosine-protein phosphatase kappa-like [Amphimedon queenslandica]